MDSSGSGRLLLGRPGTGALLASSGSEDRGPAERGACALQAPSSPRLGRPEFGGAADGYGPGDFYDDV
eukprot:5121149-Pyramimonas_sp.AAC.1